LLTIGVFGLSESPITAALTVPLLVLTIAFTFYQRNKYWDLLKYEPLPFSLEADGVYVFFLFFFFFFSFFLFFFFFFFFSFLFLLKLSE